MTDRPFRHIRKLAEVTPSYRAILCDVWGVIHNGVTAKVDAYRALRQARADGVSVILITNSPRPNAGVAEQLRALDIPDDAYDAIVTSGDVTRALIADGPREVYHIGAERDLPIFEGLDVERVAVEDAKIVVCTGLVDDDRETPDDYLDLLRTLRDRQLPFICANPDILVERGERLVYCAGALAQRFNELGGRTRIAGKPHRPIYDRAIVTACEATGAMLGQGDILAIGDGMATDVKGAADHGLDILYIADGIHRVEGNEDGLDALFASHNTVPNYVMASLA